MKPNELQLLEALNRRHPLRGKLKYYYQNLQKGYEGEKAFARLLTLFGKSSWEVYHDVSLDVSGIAQIDFLVVIGKDALLFEIKNNLGHTVFKNNQWTINGKAIANNYFIQVTRAEEKFKKMLLLEDIPLNLTSYLVFINEFNFVEIHDDEPLPVLRRSQLRDFFLSLGGSTANKRLRKKLETAFDKYRAEDHIRQDVLQELPENLTTGVYCSACHSFDVVSKPKTILCLNCAHQEAKSTIARKLIKEYQLLFPKKTPYPHAISRFSNYLISDKTIRRYLE